MSGWTSKTKATQAHIETLEKSIFAVPSHLSAFDLFPDFDEILHAVVDPIYALLEGILPFYIRKWIARALPPRISIVMICNLAYIRPLQIYFYRVLNNHNAAKTLEELMFQSKGGPVSPDRISQIFLHATTNYHRKLNYIAEDGERVVFQERQATSQKMAAIRHCDADCFVINTAAFHNIDVLLSALPRTLYQPLRILEDPWESVYDGCFWLFTLVFTLVFTRLHPRLHCCLHPRLRPVPHAALEFILPITDSSTRLSLNTRRICSAAPPRPIHSLGYSFTPTCLFDIHWQ
ncbi:hypothetical protein C362_06717 [Cryptococcus neoformans Bt1]|nr:hypothetical protein C362_06717 [Cryptococcus neoformans var. grubii Bt1]